jgi:hypothetical protein
VVARAAERRRGALLVPEGPLQSQRLLFVGHPRRRGLRFRRERGGQSGRPGPRRRPRREVGIAAPPGGRFFGQGCNGWIGRSRRRLLARCCRAASACRPRRQARRGVSSSSCHRLRASSTAAAAGAGISPLLLQLAAPELGSEPLLELSSERLVLFIGLSRLPRHGERPLAIAREGRHHQRGE